MNYHARNISQDDVIQILVNGSSFRYMEEKWPHFKEKPRNIRISLASDGVNPFAHMRSIYTVNNNIHPWLSIKREHIMWSIIIPGILCLQLFYF